MTSRFSVTMWDSSAICALRPTKLVSWGGRPSDSTVRETQGWKLVVQVGMAQLDDPLGTAKIAQLVAAQRKQPGAGWQVVGHDLFGCTGEDGLPAVRQVAQACGPVDGRPDVVALVAQVDLAGVQTDPQPDRRQGCQLQVQGARHRVTSTVERDDKAVAFALLNRPHTTMRGNHVRECAVESRDGLRHFLGLCFPELRRPFDVGEKQRHRSSR